MKQFEFFVQSSLFDRRRELIVSPDFLSIEGRDTTDPPIIFPVADIEAFRYGIKWIKGTHFIIGRTYFLEIRSAGKQTIRINLRSVYGVRRKMLGDKYVLILNALIDTYFKEIVSHYLRLLEQGLSFELAGAPVSPDGIWLNSKKELVPWIRLQVNRYVFYFNVSEKDKPDHYKVFYYEHDWNAAILLAVMDHEMAKFKLKERS